MDYSRRNITGNDKLDIKNMNDNFKYIFLKLFGNIDGGSITETTDSTTPTLEVENPKRTVFTSTLPPDPNLGEENDIYIQYTVPGGTDTSIIQSTMDME